MKIVDDKVKLNKDSSISIDESDYKQLIRMYVPYYNKLGVRGRDRRPTNYSSSKYNKVGIVEVSDFDSNYLLSQNDQFQFIKTHSTKSNNEKSYSNHGYAVTSIIGTDFGINQNASIYYTSLNNVDTVNAVKNLYYKYGVKLINMSLGPMSIFDQVGRKTTNSNSHISSNVYVDADAGSTMSINDIYKYKYFFSQLAKAILYFTYEDNKNIYNVSDIVEQYAAIGQFALENDIKIIQSSGNDNDELSKIVIGNDFLNKTEFMKNGNLSASKIYETFKSFFNSVMSFSEKYWPNKNDRDSNINLVNKIQRILDNALGDLNWKFNEQTGWLKTFNFEDFADLEIRKKKLFNGLSSWQSLHYHDGIISVGSVNWRNVATTFSSYAKDNYGTYPLVSAFGDTLKNDSEELTKNNYYKRDYYKIKNYIESTKDSEEFRNKMTYLFNFNGTSKAAPLITGLVSRLQGELNKELSIAKVKLLLASSSNYSSTKATKLNEFGFDEMSSEYEYWRSNRSKNKTGFGIPKYFKMRSIQESEKIKITRPHELGKNFITSKNVRQLYYKETFPVQWRYWTTTFVWKHKKSFSEYWQLHILDNNPFVSWFRNKWLPDLLGAIKYKKLNDASWNIIKTPFYSIDTELESFINLGFESNWKEYIYSTEPNTGVQRIFAFKPYPIAIDSYEIYIRYSELEEYLKLFWDYIIHKNNITLDNNDANSSYYDATHPALQPYKKYIPQIKQKYWEHLKENVWLESYTDLYEVKPAEF
ncbi:S8 family serine peptidase [Mycoplasmopsis agalactiae]